MPLLPWRRRPSSVRLPHRRLAAVEVVAAVEEAVEEAAIQVVVAMDLAVTVVVGGTVLAAAGVATAA